MFDLRPVALEDMVRGTVNVRRARVWKLGHIFAVVVRRLVTVVQAALCSRSRLECGLTLAIPLAQHQILPLNLAS